MICFVVAWSVEAEPLIERWSLQPEPEAANVRIYSGEGVRLVISGIGWEAAERAVKQLAGEQPVSSDRVWINLGIGGHRTLPLGQGRLAGLVTEDRSGEVWHLPEVTSAPFGLDRVRTVDRVETEYRDDWIYEMEASGYCRAVESVGEANSMCVLKIISDNRESGVESITPDGVRRLIEAQLENVEILIGLLEDGIERSVG